MIAEKVPPTVHTTRYSGLNNPWVARFMEGTTRRCTSDGFSPHYRVHRDILETMASLSLTGKRIHLRECMTI